MLTGWISEDTGKIGEDEEDPFATATYYAGGENDGVLRKGWHAYVDGTSDTYDASYGEQYSRGEEGSGWDPSDADVIWFYFQTSNCKMLKSTANDNGTLRTKKINGKTYAFTHDGLMFEGWTAVGNGTTVSGMQYKYYNESTGGNLTKKGWIFNVPTAYQNYTDYLDSEDRWFYADGSGKTVISQTKKINGKYYIFDYMGIMQKGLLLTTAGNKYIAKVKLDETDGKRFITNDAFVVDDASGNEGDTDDYVFEGTLYHYAYGDWGMFPTNPGAGSGNRFFYFKDTDEGGERQTGTITLEFSDNDYTFVSSNSGGYMGSKNSGNRFYAQGILLKANPDIKYGIVTRTTRDAIVNNHGSITETGTVVPQQDALRLWDVVAVSTVVTTSGSKIKKNAIKKDGNDNYWVVEAGKFMGAYNVQMKRSNGYYQYKSDFYKPDRYGAVSSDTSSGYGWCFHINGYVTSDARTLKYDYHSSNSASFFTAGNAGDNQYCVDVNGKFCVYPMVKDITDPTGRGAWEPTTWTAPTTGQQDFNAILEDEMGVDFYWDVAEKN